MSGRQSTIERPDPVRRVIPPITTIKKIIPKMIHSQVRTDCSVLCALLFIISPLKPQLGQEVKPGITVRAGCKKGGNCNKWRRRGISFAQSCAPQIPKERLASRSPFFIGLTDQNFLTLFVN